MKGTPGASWAHSWLVRGSPRREHRSAAAAAALPGQATAVLSERASSSWPSTRSAPAIEAEGCSMCRLRAGTSPALSQTHRSPSTLVASRWFPSGLSDHAPLVVDYAF